MKKSPFSARHQRALAAIKKGRDRDALEHFAAAARAQPRSTALRLDYARFLTCLFRFSEARDQLRAACEIRPDSPEVLLAAGKVVMDGRAPELALEWFAKVPDHPAARFHSALLLERMGCLEEAADQLLAAETLAGETADGRLLAARIAARAGDFSTSLAILDQILEKAPSAPWTQARIHYARGRALDGLQEYDDAFAAWSTAKARLQPLAGDRLAQSEAHTTAYHDFASRLTPELLGSWREEANPIEHPSPVMLTGFPRSGTSLLDRLLTEVTGLPSADENTSFRDLVWRRVGVWNKDVDRQWEALQDIEAKKIAGPLSDYQSALVELSGAEAGAPWILDKNPQLLAVLPLMLRLMPSLPVIAIHRDPRDVILSFFAQPFGLNNTSVHFLSMQNGAAHYARVRAIGQLVQSVLGDRMLVTRYEVLVADPAKETGRLARKLGRLCGFETRAGERSAADRIFWSPTYDDVAKPVTRAPVGRWKNYAKHLEPHFSHLEPWIGPDTSPL